MIFTVDNFKDSADDLSVAFSIAGGKIRDDTANKGLTEYASRQEFELKDSWFGDMPKSTDTVVRALKEHCGIEVEFEKSGAIGLKITSFAIADEDQYNGTVGAAKKAEKATRLPQP